MIKTDVDFSDKAKFYEKLSEAKKKDKLVGVYRFGIGNRLDMFSINANNIFVTAYSQITIPQLRIENFVPVSYIKGVRGYNLKEESGNTIIINFG